jgi:hypothetical protein
MRNGKNRFIRSALYAEGKSIPVLIRETPPCKGVERAEETNGPVRFACTC